MGLWSLVGGVAHGFSDERKYLDAQAKEARDQAMRAREQLLREQTNQSELAYRGQEQANEAERAAELQDYHHQDLLNNLEIAKLQAEAKHESDMADLQKQREEFAFKVKYPAFAGPGAARDQFLRNLPEPERLKFELLGPLFEKPLGEGERLEDRQSQINQGIRNMEEQFPRLFPQAKARNKAEITDTLINSLFKGVKTQDQAIMELKKAKMDPKYGLAFRAGVVDEDKVMKYITGLPNPRKAEYQPSDLDLFLKKTLYDPIDRAASITDKALSNVGSDIGQAFTAPMKSSSNVAPIAAPILRSPLSVPDTTSDAWKQAPTWEQADSIAYAGAPNTLAEVDAMLAARRLKRMSDARAARKNPH